MIRRCGSGDVFCPFFPVYGYGIVTLDLVAGFPGDQGSRLYSERGSSLVFLHHSGNGRIVIDLVALDVPLGDAGCFGRRVPPHFGGARGIGSHNDRMDGGVYRVPPHFSGARGIGSLKKSRSLWNLILFWSGIVVITFVCK